MIDYNTLTVTEATQLQKNMQQRLDIRPFEGSIKTIAGADLSFNRFSPTVYAGIVVLSYPKMEVLSYSLVKAEVKFPYVSGYLAFREIPALQLAWDQLPEKPDLVVLDGQGLTHPRKLGIATHFGILNDLPTIGCAKTPLFGKYDEPNARVFSKSPIIGKESEKIGYVFRSKKACKPIFVSPGHLTDPDSAVEIIKKCCGKYRIPEPTRQAHNHVNLFRTGVLAAGYHRVKP